MSGSLLGRGRAGRLVLYGGCPLLIFILVFLYHAATSEMDRLRELQEQCVHQQEALAAQLQVIFEYKVRLEKSLAEEKSSNAAIKQELQQRATREKSLRDKDSIEAMQRFNSLQQTYKILQSEHEDLKEECKKREKLALDETTRLETTLQDLRSQLRQLHKDNDKVMENLKNNYMTLLVDHENLEKKYNVTAKSNSENEMTVLHLKKEIIQLQREVEELRGGKNNFARSTPSSEAVLRVSLLASRKPDSAPIPAPHQQQHQQQVSPPLPLLHASRDYRADGREAAQSEEKVNNDANEPANNIGFIQKNGNIIPADPNEVKEATGELEAQQKQQQQQKVAERDSEEEQKKQVMLPPLNRDDDDDAPKNDYIPAAQAEHPLTPSAIEKLPPASSLISVKEHAAENDELQNLQNRLARNFVS